MRICDHLRFKKSPGEESNPRPEVYKTSALPIELPGHIFAFRISYFVNTINYLPHTFLKACGK